MRLNPLHPGIPRALSGFSLHHLLLPGGGTPKVPSTAQGPGPSSKSSVSEQPSPLPLLSICTSLLTPLHGDHRQPHPQGSSGWTASLDSSPILRGLSLHTGSVTLCPGCPFVTVLMVVTGCSSCTRHHLSFTPAQRGGCYSDSPSAQMSK